MSKRPGRVGQWVLPVAATFISLGLLWAVLRIIAVFVSGPSDAATYLAGAGRVVMALTVATGCGTLAGVAFVTLAMLQRLMQESDAPQTEQILRRQSQLLEQINDGVMLSDRAKAVALREREREALRHAIHEDLAKQDWEAAYHLIEEMQRGFGYNVEAERLRREVDQRRRETVLANLAAEMGRFRDLLNTHDWEAARAEAEKLSRRYPGQEQVRNLTDEVDEAREAYKRRLLSEFKQAIDRSEFDRGVAILKELDQYLTPGEAAGLQEAARGVFRAKLHNLGVQFSMAISEKNWAESIKIGQDIIEEFPNSRMAEEVRENIEVLRKRAAETAEAGK